MDSIWYVYLAACADGSLYCGITTDPARRLAQHNGERPGGARYTRSRRPVRLAGTAACPDHATAARLERIIQRSPRARKLRLLEEYAALRRNRASCPEAPGAPGAEDGRFSGPDENLHP